MQANTFKLQTEFTAVSRMKILTSVWT